MMPLGFGNVAIGGCNEVMDGNGTGVSSGNYIDSEVIVLDQGFQFFETAGQYVYWHFQMICQIEGDWGQSKS